MAGADPTLHSRQLGLESLPTPKRSDVTTMKQRLIKLLQDAIAKLQQQEELLSGIDINVQIERARDKQHGDYASNIAMMLAKPANRSPRDLAEFDHQEYGRR